MALDHGLRTITVTVNLDPAPATQQGFSNILLLVDEASNPLASRVTTFTSYPEAVTAQAAGAISSGTLSLLQTMFSQAPRLARVKVGKVDTAGGETWAQGYAACIAADADVYGVCMATRTAADVVAVSNAIEAGVDFKVIASWVGHKDGGVLVAKTYGHLRDTHSFDMAKRMDFSC